MGKTTNMDKLKQLGEFLDETIKSLQEGWKEYQAMQCATRYGHEVAVELTKMSDEDVEMIMNREGYYLCPTCQRYYTDVHDANGNVIGCELCQLRAIGGAKRCIECARKYDPKAMGSKDPFCCVACQDGY